MTTKANKSSVLPLKPLVWHDASGIVGVYSEKTESYIKDALWFCSTLVAEYVIRKSPDGVGFVVNYGGRTENIYDTVEEAKEWCEFTHYKDKMKPYVESVPNLGDVEYMAWDKEGKVLLKVESLHLPLGKPSWKDIVVETEGGLEWRGIGEVILLEVSKLNKGVINE